MPYRTPPRWDAICLVQLYGVSNAQVHVVVSAVSAPHIVEILQLFLDRHLNAIEPGNLVGCANEATLGAGAVVAIYR